MATSRNRKNQQESRIPTGSRILINKKWYLLIRLTDSNEIIYATLTGKTIKTGLYSEIRAHIKPMFV